jgi:hypothetical protein
MLRDLKEDAGLKQEKEAAITIKDRTDHSPTALFSVLYISLALTVTARTNAVYCITDNHNIAMREVIFPCTS